MAGGRFNHLETDSARKEERKDLREFPGAPGEEDDLSAKPLSYDEIIGRGDEHFYAGEWKKALQLYSRALNTETRSKTPWVGQVLCLLFMDQVREAEVWSRRAVEAFPEDTDIVALRGVVVARTGMVNQGVGASDYAMAKSSTGTIPWMFRAWMLLEGENENWRPTMEKAMESIGSDQWRHHVLMGLILEQYRKYSMAISAYRRALEIQPEQFYTWYRLGVCYRHLGMQRPALEAQQQARALRPWHSDVEAELQKASKGFNLAGLFRRWFSKE